MRAIIIAGGRISNYSWYADFWQEDDFVICADSGAEHARKLGIIPSLLVGDLDSISQETLIFFQNKGCQVQAYNKEKNETDTQIALEFALQQKRKEIIFLAALGNRIDHSLSNIFLLTSLLSQDIKASFISEYQEICLVDGCLEFEGKKGEIVSLLPLTDEVRGIETSGLKYIPLGNHFVMSNPYGVSNVLEKEKAYIKVEKGILLVIRIKQLSELEEKEVFPC